MTTCLARISDTRTCVRSTTLPLFSTLAASAAAVHAKPAEREPTHDPAGDADEHDDADLHPNRDAAPLRLRREQDESAWSPGARAAAADETVSDGGSARSEHEALRPHTEPARGRSRRDDDRGPAAQVEHEARRHARRPRRRPAGVRDA